MYVSVWMCKKLKINPNVYIHHPPPKEVIKNENSKNPEKWSIRPSLGKLGRIRTSRPSRNQDSVELHCISKAAKVSEPDSAEFKANSVESYCI